MEKLILNVFSGEDCNLGIEDYSTYPDDFKYEDTVSIDYIKYNKSETKDKFGNPIDNTELHGPYLFNHKAIHRTSFYQHFVRPLFIPINYDGWLTVYHFILPKYTDVQSEEKFYVILNKDSNLGFYLYYGKDLIRFYEFTSDTKQEYDEYTEFDALFNDDSVVKTQIEFVSICHLIKCYIDLCRSFLDNHDCDDLCFAYNNGKELSEEVIDKITALKIFIQAIKTLMGLIEEGDTEYLQKILLLIELIMSCKGLCTCCSDMILKSCNCK